MTKATKLAAVWEAPERLELPAASLGPSPGTFSTRSPLPRGWGAQGVQDLLSNLKANQALAGFLNPLPSTVRMRDPVPYPNRR